MELPHAFHLAIREREMDHLRSAVGGMLHRRVVQMVRVVQLEVMTEISIHVVVLWQEEGERKMARCYPVALARGPEKVREARSRVHAAGNLLNNLTPRFT